MKWYQDKALVSGCAVVLVVVIFAGTIIERTMPRHSDAPPAATTVCAFYTVSLRNMKVTTDEQGADFTIETTCAVYRKEVNPEYVVWLRNHPEASHVR